MLQVPFSILVLLLLLWPISKILHKAGFSRWYALLILLTGGIGLIVFALADWPVYRELGWLRLKAGDTSDRVIALAERYAIDLEKRGDWKQAIEVYGELAQKATTGEGTGYYQSCLKRINERLVES